MGQPYEPDYWRQFRDSKTPRPDDRVYAPMPQGKYSPPMEELRCLLQEMQIRQGLQLEDILRKTGIFSKQPAYVQPPFFSNPLIKIQEVTLAVSASFGTVFSIPIPGRHALILTSCGMAYDDTVAAMSNSILWRFRFNGDIVNFIEDNTLTPGTQAQGTFAHPLGSFDNPLNFMQRGCSPRLKANADTSFVLEARNTGAGPVGSVEVSVIVSMYIYRYDHNAEFEQ